jgi:alpha-galactosidase
LELHSHWFANAAYGPVAHEITIRNFETGNVELPLQPSLRLGLNVSKHDNLVETWVEKSAGGPSDRGTHREAMGSGFKSLLKSGPYGEDAKRDAIPWVSLQNIHANCGVFAGIEFSGKVAIDIARKSDNQLRVQLGQLINPTDSTRVYPGESYRPPIVFIGAYQGSVDDGGNQMRRWLRQTVCPPMSDPKYPLLTLNSWGSGMAIDRRMASSMSRDAARLGLDLFHIDAGWFRTIGDWRYDDKKFPTGIREVSDSVHKLGLKFGLWTGWTQGGVGDDVGSDGKTLNVFSPSRRNWFSNPPKPGWKPQDFVGSDVCLSSPSVQTWCSKLLDGLVTEYGVDMLEHDQRMIVEACTQTGHPHTASPSDISYRAALGYYHVYDDLRKKHPNLLLEDCVNGGRMVDFGVLKRVNYISISDTYTPVPNRQTFYDTSYALPPAACECYVSDREPVKNDAEFLTMLRSGMMGWFTLMQDPAHWSGHRFNLAKVEFSRYKRELRPLIRNGNLFHSLPRPTGHRWDGVQYASPDGLKSVVFAFRGHGVGTSQIFPLRGLKTNHLYSVHFADGTQPDQVVAGSRLMKNGIQIHLSDPDGSELVSVTAK